MQNTIVAAKSPVSEAAPEPLPTIPKIQRLNTFETSSEALAPKLTATDRESKSELTASPDPGVAKRSRTRKPKARKAEVATITEKKED